MDQLLTDNVWGQIAALSKAGDSKVASIAYVTNDTDLSFRTGDVLVCDASNGAIKSGETSAKTLKRFFDAGARLYSCPGLHAKALVTSDLAVIGSSNLSVSAAMNLIEASFVTRRFQARSQVRAFIEKLVRVSTVIDYAFLARALELPVTTRPRISSRPRDPIQPPTNRTWVVSTAPLSESIIEKEVKFEVEGQETARERIGAPESELSSIRWAGKSRFRSAAQEGDSVIELERNEKRNRCKVIQPRPIILRQDNEKWTRFYLADPPAITYLPWRQFSDSLHRLGIGQIKMNTTRELSQGEVSLMELIWIEE